MQYLRNQSRRPEERALRSRMRFSVMWLLTAMAAVQIMAVCMSACQAAPAVLIVGGGPDGWHNQVAIESNVRYVLGLFPDHSSRMALFADGNPQSRTVLCEKPLPAGSDSSTALDLLLSPDGDLTRSTFLRVPHLPQMDGASSKATIDDAVSRLAKIASGRQPLVLYFTGHGSGKDDSAAPFSTYLLWHDVFSGPELARQVRRLPPEDPVVVIMAQCFAGGFAPDLLTTLSDSAGGVNRDVAGFFGATEDRVAAGCTPDIREADYEDFTSYFMAALSGRDRLGRAISGADYNGDGEVGMDEAFCYALIHDPTIDVPICTSDTFLRSHVKVGDDAVFSLPFRTIRSWATAAQAAALDALAAQLSAGKGNPRASISPPANVDLQRLYQIEASTRDQDASAADTYNRAEGQYEDERAAIRSWLLRRWPALRHPGGARYSEARQAALTILSTSRRSTASHLLKAYSASDRIMAQWESAQALEARRLRLLRLAKTVVLTHLMMTNGPGADRETLTRLLRSEQRPLFPREEPVTVAAAPEQSLPPL